MPRFFHSIMQLAPVVFFSAPRASRPLWECWSRFIFDRIASRYEPPIAKRLEEYLAPLKAALPLIEPSPEKIIDLASGTGIYARVLKRHYPHAQVTGLDLSQAMIDEAKRLTEQEGLSVTYTLADARRPPAELRGADLVVIAHAYPYFKEAADLLAPGGYLLYTLWFGGAGFGMMRRRITRRLQGLNLTPLLLQRAGEGCVILARKR